MTADSLRSATATAPGRVRPRIALVHDWLNQIGGAEDVLDALAGCYPGSPIYTSIFAPSHMPSHYQDWDIRTLWLDRLPAIHRHHQAYLPCYPIAWNNLKIRDYDVILSNKSGFCHCLRFSPESLHICYCLAPTRYIWQLEEYLAGENLGDKARRLLGPLTRLIRTWDYAAAQRVSHFIAISSAVQARIRRYYNRESDIIFPPVDTDRFQPRPAEELEDYFLVVSRLIPYKRIDLAVRAATELGLPLKIAGAGRDRGRLEAIAGDTVEFLGYVPDEELPSLMSKCKALIFPGLEDFGITPVQAQAAGRPVIAFCGGGALDTVIPGVTGEFFSELSVESLKATWHNIETEAYNPERIRRHALQFDKRVFVKRISAYIDQAWTAHQANQRFQFRDPERAAEG